MTAEYVSTLELAKFIRIDRKIPDRTRVGTARPEEKVGTGDDSTTRFFFDHANIIAGSYTIRYSTSEAVSGTALVENVDYSVNKEIGELNLLTGATTKVSSHNIYAKYSFIDAELTDGELQDALDREEDEFKDDTNNHWVVDSGTATPGYLSITNEEHRGKGKFERDYYLEKFPLPDVSTTMIKGVATSGGTITVASTFGFPEEGTLGIEADKITYTGKTGSTFTGCTSVSEHGTSNIVYPFAIEISGTDPGTIPSWTVLQKDADFDIDFESGRVHIFRSDNILSTLSISYPQRLVPNRFRASYIWGNGNVPEDVKIAILKMASREILHSAVRKSEGKGYEKGNERMINIDDADIEKALNRHRNNQITNI